MASELNIDTQFLRNLKSANENLQNIVQTTERATKAFKDLVSGTSAFDVLAKIQAGLAKMSGQKVEVNIEAKGLKELAAGMSDTIEQVQLLQNAELFDNSKLHKTSEIIFSIEKNLSDTQTRMDELRKKWNILSEGKQYTKTQNGIEALDFVEPTNDKGRKIRKDSNVYKQLRAEYDLKVQLLKDEVEAEVRQQIELQAIQKKQLEWAKMTMAERAEYVQKELNKILKEEQKNINEVRKLYSGYLSEMNSLSSKINKNEGKNEDGALTAQIDIQKSRYMQLDALRRELEEGYGAYIVDIAEKANARAADITAARLRKEADAKKEAEKEALEKYLSSSEGALKLASDASTINEMKEAQKYLQIARGNVDVKDTEAIKKLNDEYTRLRMTIESLTTAEKNEQSLQPTLKNEYARLLVELDKITEAKERASKTQAFKDGNLAAQQEMNSLIERENDIREKMAQIEKAAVIKSKERIKLEKELAFWTAERANYEKSTNARDIRDARAGKGTQAAKDYLFADSQVAELQAKLNAVEENESALDDIIRKHEANRAMASIALTEKTEAQKAEIAHKKILEQQELRRQTATRSSARANQIIDESENAKNVAQEEQAIKRLEDARRRLNKNDVNYNETLERLNQKIDEHTHKIKMATDAQYRENHAKEEARKKNTTFDGAMEYSKNTQSINEQIQALKYLKEARANLNKGQLGSKEYESRVKAITKEIKRQQEELDKLTGHVKKTNTSFGSLASNLKTIFSLGAISNYIKKLVDVRGEFEMQQKALTAIIQDQDKAAEIWNKTVAMAVKSPFRVKDLVTYTKQLAAYRIETERLYETNKMLADVSAGLGVDMDRLILAYGQVKAANYLRGTELRQFSEAGVNILEGLAKYFEEIEGRAVSVGEVFDRVSKRMVTFEHVDTVFKRITDRGGVFYQMQEKQSETLRGMVMNLRDSYDLMLNEIGKDNDSMLKGSLKIAKEMVDNWRTLEPIVKSVGSAFLIYFSAKKLMAIGNAIKLLMSAFNTHPIVMAFSAVAALGAAIYQAANAQSKLNQIMSEVENDNLKLLREDIALYHELVDTINDATKSHEERNNALSELQRRFKDILPDQKLEIDYIKALKGSYKEAEDAMFAYYNAKTRKQKEDRIRTEYAESIETDTQDLIGEFKSNIQHGPFSERYKEVLLSGIGGAVRNAIQDIENGKIEPEQLMEEIYKRIDKYAGSDTFSKHKKKISPLVNIIKKNEEEIISSYKEMNAAIEGLQGLSYETHTEAVVGEALKAEEKNIATATKLFKNAARRYEDVVKKNLGANQSLYGLKKQIESDLNQSLKDVPEGFENYVPLIEDVFEKLRLAAEKGVYDFNIELQKISSDFYAKKDDKGNVIGGLAATSLKNANISEEYYKAGADLMKNFQEGLIAESEKLKFDGTQKALDEGIREISEKFDVDIDLFKDIVPKANQSLDEVRKALSAQITSYKEKIKEFETSTQVGLFVLTTEVLNQTKASIEQMKKELPALQAVFNFVGGDTKEKKTGGTQKNWFVEMAKSIRDTHNDFVTFHKDLEKSKALAEALSKNEDVFNEAAKNAGVKLSLSDFTEGFDKEEGVLDMLAKILDYIPEKSKNARYEVEKLIRLLKGEEAVKDAQEAFEELSNSFDSLFGEYELTLNLKEAGFNSDWIEGFFKVPTTTLNDIRAAIRGVLGDAAKDIKDDESLKKAIKESTLDDKTQDELLKTLKKITEEERKALQKRLEQYIEYSTKTLTTVSQIRLKEAQELHALNEIITAEIERVGKETEAGMKLAEVLKTLSQSIKDTANSDVISTEWDEFKSSESFIQFFEDAEFATTKSINNMLDQLEEFRKGLVQENDVELMRAVVKEMEKLEKIKLERAPFMAIINAFKDLKDYRDKRSNYELSGLDIYGVENKSGFNSNKDIDNSIGQINDAIEGLRKKYQEAVSSGDSVVATSLDEDIKKLKEGKKGLEDLKSEGADAGKTLRESFSAFGDKLTEIGQSLPQFQAAFENMGIGFSQGMKDAIATTSEVLTGVGSAIQGFASGNYLQGVLGVVSAIGSLFQIGDKRKERQIQREIKFVEKLSKEYEKLEESIDEAYSTDTLKMSYDAAQQNLEEQIAATERMIELEKQKKKTDDERVKQWEEENEKRRKQQEELMQQEVEKYGGNFDIRSVAEDFVNAWLDAFKETGDGLKGLEENFKETMKNIAIQQAVMSGVGTIIKPLQDKINDALEGDFTLDSTEMSEIDELGEQTVIQVDDYMKKLFGEDGVFSKYLDTEPEDGELTGLQKGIQGVTEETAQIIEGYLNSIRFFVAEKHRLLSDFISSFSVNAEIENPIISQLKIIARNTTSMEQILSSVVLGDHSRGGAGLKVFMD